MKILRKDLWQHINPDTNYYCYAIISTNDGDIEITSDEDIIASGNSFTHSAGEGFPLGQSLCKTIKLTIDNTDKKYIDYDFTGATVTLYTEIGEPEYDENGNDISQREYILEGLFYITDTIDTRGDIIEINAYDGMIKFDRPLLSSWQEMIKSGTLMLQDLFYGICREAGFRRRDIDTVTDALIYGTYLGQEEITFIPDNLTNRQMLSYIAGMLCGNAIITPEGKVAIKRWDFYNETPVITGNKATDLIISDNEATDIITSEFGTTIIKDNITYFIPETTTLNNALDEITTATDDVIITALKCKYHATITGGTKEKTEVLGIHDTIDYVGKASECYKYVAKIIGVNSLGKEIKIEKDLTPSMVSVKYGSSPPNPIEGADAFFDEEKKISGSNNLYYFSLTDEQAEAFVGAIEIRIYSIYNGSKLYTTTIRVNAYSELLSGNHKLYNYEGAEVPLTTQNPPSTGEYYITNGQEIEQQVYDKFGYGLAYEPNIFAVEEYYTLDIEFLTDESTGTNFIVPAAERILGVAFRPFNGKFVPNPTVEIMDSVYIEDKNEVYFSFITDLNFTYLGESEFKNQCESKEKKDLAYGTINNNSQWEQIQYCRNKVDSSNTRSLRSSTGQTVLLPTSIDNDGKITDYITCTLRDGGIWQN